MTYYFRESPEMTRLLERQSNRHYIEFSALSSTFLSSQPEEKFSSSVGTCCHSLDNQWRFPTIFGLDTLRANVNTEVPRLLFNNGRLLYRSINFRGFFNAIPDDWTSINIWLLPIK